MSSEFTRARKTLEGDPTAQPLSIGAVVHLGEAYKTIAQLQAELAEQKERLGKALKLQMDERHKSEAEAKLWFDKAQKWGAELAEAREVPGRIVDWIRSGAGPYVEGYGGEIATAIEARDWSKP